MPYYTEINISKREEISIKAFEMALNSSQKVNLVSKYELYERVWFDVESESLLELVFLGKHWQLHELELKKGG
jgi:hypothetical protein